MKVTVLVFRGASLLRDEDSVLVCGFCGCGKCPDVYYISKNF